MTSKMWSQLCAICLCFLHPSFLQATSDSSCSIDAQWSGDGEIVALKNSSASSEQQVGSLVAVEGSCSSQGCDWIWATGSLDRSSGKITLHRNDGLVMEGHMAADCGILQWTNGRQWVNLNLQIRKVHVVFMAHFDVGYTDNSVKDLLYRYATSWFPIAMQTARTLRSRGGVEQFAWTSHPWLIAALLKNQSGNISPEFIYDLEAAIQRDDIRWHANPMNMQSEAGERFNMEYGMTLSVELDKRFGKSKKIAASQKDEPGMTLGMVRMFADAGVKMLHVGVNDFSTVPAMPSNSAFYHSYCNPSMWQDDDPSFSSIAELLVLYCSGYSGPFEAHVEEPNMMTVLPGHDEALVYLMHVDNRGPQTATQALEGYAAARRMFPNAEVHLSTMDAWYQGVLQSRSKLPALALPVVRNKEPGSTWIYGVASQPQKMRWYRAVARIAARAVKEGVIDPADPRFREFQRLLLKVPEHTWGASGGCEGNFTNAQFHDPQYVCHVGSAAETSYRASLTDQQDFIPRALVALEDLQPLRRECERAINSSEPEQPELVGLESFDWSQPVTTAGGITIEFNKSGAIISLIRKGGTKNYASRLNPLGLFQYATHSEEELDKFGRQYALSRCAQECGHCSFSKCNLHAAGAESFHHQAIIKNAWANTTSGRFLFNLTFLGAELQTKYGAPKYATLEVSAAAGTKEDAMIVDFDLQWWEKPSTRMAESLWMTFSPNGVAKHGWEMDKMGRWIDPFMVSINGSQTMHGIWSGIRHRTGAVFLDSVDAPIVMPGNSLSPTGAFNQGDAGLPHPERGWSFNLFNNAWSTNYPFFSLNSAERFRWKLALGEPVDAQVTYV